MSFENPTNYDMAATIAPQNTNPVFAFSPRIVREAPPRACPPAKPGWATPLDKPQPEVGTADPIWGTAFTTKFHRNKVDVKAPPAQPEGVAKVITNFIDRAAEIAYIAETQHQELATTLAEMKTNGIDGFSLSAATDEMESANIAASHLRRTPFACRAGTQEVVIPEHIRFLMNLFGFPEAETYTLPVYADMVYAANMARRIEWEKFIFACGPIHRVRFERMRDGSLGIAYQGKDKSPDAILTWKRLLKTRWLESHDSLPEWEDIKWAKAEHDYYKTPVLFMLSDVQHDEYISSKMFGTEDPDPGRVVFHSNPDPKPQRDQYSFRNDHGACIPVHNGCETDGWEMYNADVLLWETRQSDRGYAGPSGLLGIDESSSTSSFEDDENAQ